MIDVRLFSKDDCQLCDEAKEVLARVQKEIPFTLTESKIVPGEPSFDQFKDSIPVVTINGSLAFTYRVDEQTLRRRLRDISR
jgi:hypothetical protein